MTQSNLVLHCGAAKVERSQLTDIVTPQGGQTWCPIPHATLVAEVEGALVRANMRIVSEAHGLSADGARYFGLLQVANGEEQGDYSYVLGLRNSHDKRFPAGLVVGSAVFVCDNLSFSGEINIARKHTRFITRDLPGLVAGAVGQLGDRWHSQAERIDAYRQHELSDVQAHDMIIRALDNRAITVTQVPGILKEWRTPRHPEFSAGGSTAWRFLNAVTETAKGSGLWALPQRTQALHALLDGEVGLFSKN
jgi:hypothetical protein